MSTFEYSGTELELFAHAKNWKAYWRRALAPFVRGDVLEVGAGTGTNTPVLAAATTGRWTCLEPDPSLLEQARVAHRGSDFAARCSYAYGTLATFDVAGTERFDTVLYLDVLEHIEHDRAELVLASQRLRPGGRVIVLAPAHQKLFSEFDRAIGHFRRYDRASLVAVEPTRADGMERERLFYLDSVGLLASLANRLMLHQSRPSLAQIRVWDHFFVTASRVLDVVTRRRLGKSIVGVWRRTDVRASVERELTPRAPTDV